MSRKLTAHQESALLHIADATSWPVGIMTGCNTQEVGLRTARALEKKGLVETHTEIVGVDMAYSETRRHWERVSARLTDAGRALAATL